MLTRFHLVAERNGQTDGRTDRFAVSISRVSVLTRGKNTTKKSATSLHTTWLIGLRLCVT